MEQSATLVKREATSKAGNPYSYVAVLWQGEEIGRLFLRPFEMAVIFGEVICDALYCARCC